MSLRPFARTALWAGGGAYLGVFISAIVLDSQRAAFWLIPWTIVFALYVGAVFVVGRERAGQRRTITPTRAPDAAAPRLPSDLRVTLEFPDVPHGFPAVTGAIDPLSVIVTVRGEAGAAVRLVAKVRDGPGRVIVGEGVSGSDGSVTFTIRPPGLGELLLEAEASHGEAKGQGSAHISVVRYSDEIERLFAEFRVYAQQALGPEAHSHTARELAEQLRDGATPAISRALLELARVYEIVAYGQREADRGSYLVLVGALLVLERDGSDDRPGQAVTAHGA